MSARRGHGEGSIHKRERDGRWVAVLDLGFEAGKRRRVSVTGRTRREVSDRLKAMTKAHDEGDVVVPSRLRVSAFLQRWLDEVVDPSDLSDSTKSFYRTQVLKHLIPSIGDLVLAKLTLADVERLLAKERSDGLSARSVQAIHATLRRALKHAVRWGMIRHNPASEAEVPSPRRDDAKVHALDRDSIVRLLGAAEGDRLEAMIVLLAMLGLRKGEALALRWSRVDMDAGVLTVDSSLYRKKGVGMVLKEPKTRHSVRSLSLPEQCLVLLRQHKRNQIAERLLAGPDWQDRDLVFCTSVGTALDLKAPNVLLDRLCDAAGISRERVHNLRHSAATTAGEVAQGDLGLVKSMLGHSSIAVTIDMYRQILPESQQRLGKAIGDYYKRGIV